ncbi:MAG TPA: hypothetical protein VNW68_06725, partial [Candidatus Limnocylindria bacterium]|nr:hypothetical protein [Candidatus Limnocylindria bacterium]
FGVGSLWVALYGWLIGELGEGAGIPLTFWLMALAFVVAAAVVLPIRSMLRTGEDTETLPAA